MDRSLQAVANMDRSTLDNIRLHGSTFLAFKIYARQNSNVYISIAGGVIVRPEIYRIFTLVYI